MRIKIVHVGNTQKWYEYSNLTCRNQIRLNFLHSQAIGTLKDCSHIKKFSPIFKLKYRPVILSITGNGPIQPVIHPITIDTMLN